MTSRQEQPLTLEAVLAQIYAETDRLKLIKLCVMAKQIYMSKQHCKQQMANGEWLNFDAMPIDSKLSLEMYKANLDKLTIDLVQDEMAKYAKLNFELDAEFHSLSYQPSY